MREVEGGIEAGEQFRVRGLDRLQQDQRGDARAAQPVHRRTRQPGRLVDRPTARHQRGRRREDAESGGLLAHLVGQNPGQRQRRRERRGIEGFGGGIERGGNRIRLQHRPGRAQGEAGERRVGRERVPPGLLDAEGQGEPERREERRRRGLETAVERRRHQPFRPVPVTDDGARRLSTAGLKSKPAERSLEPCRAL